MVSDTLEDLLQKFGMTSLKEKFDEDVTNYRFLLRRGITSGIWFNFKEFRFCKTDLNNIMAFVHEFTEFSIIMVFQKLKVEPYKKVKFKGYKETYMEHFISLGGTDNGTNLEPETRENRREW